MICAEGEKRKKNYTKLKKNYDQIKSGCNLIADDSIELSFAQNSKCLFAYCQTKIKDLPPLRNFIMNKRTLIMKK